MDFADDWSEDDLQPLAGPSQLRSAHSSGRGIEAEEELVQAHLKIAQLRHLLQNTISQDKISEPFTTNGTASKGNGKGKMGRDDDTHYFDSYAENGSCDPPKRRRPINDIMQTSTKSC